jgi:hypothetical protein
MEGREELVKERQNQATIQSFRIDRIGLEVCLICLGDSRFPGHVLVEYERLLLGRSEHKSSQY